ncbi:MAG: hypothetical protein HRT61_06050 [Ekhidna sp.]|nr:hypothetical protein [Ekhidna sp.]
MKRTHVILLSSLVLVLTFVYYFFLRESTIEDLQGYAKDEFEYIYPRSQRSQFEGPIISEQTEKGVEFCWIKIEDCDTTKVFVYVSRKAFVEPETSSITKGCD